MSVSQSNIDVSLLMIVDVLLFLLLLVLAWRLLGVLHITVKRGAVAAVEHVPGLDAQGAVDVGP